MDEWRDFYYSMNPGARNVEIGDLSPRKKLRQDLKEQIPLLFTVRAYG
jgi:polypeptide N-acetylgalactosaminyltransferase